MLRLITAYAVRTVGVLFKQQINWHWITCSEYPQSELYGLFNCFKSKFTFDGLEEELKAVFSSQVKERFKDYMKSTRDEAFKKFKIDGECYFNCPSTVEKYVWHQMVDKWLSEKWQVLYIHNFCCLIIY